MAAVHSLSMKHVLLLDDDREVSCVLLSLLEEEGYYVSVCRHVEAACEFLDRVKIDLFIADVLLPDGTVFAAMDAAGDTIGSAPVMRQDVIDRANYADKPHMRLGGPLGTHSLPQVRRAFRNVSVEQA